jgi:class 3 adenylate cyclase/predicted ATPase
MAEIRTWLRDNGFERFADLFEENEIDFDVLPELSDAHLKDLGIPLGPRVKLLKVIKALGASSDDDLPVTEKPSPTASTVPSHEAERRQLTVMFVDLVGSTAISSRLDPEEMREVIAAYQNAVADVVTRFEGYVAKYMGDGILCFFGWPRAHEDDAERAVRAALAVMQLLPTVKTPDGESLAARAGIATGLVVVGDLIGEGAAQEEAVIGETPNLAARLQGLAQPGQVVVAAATRHLLFEMFELADLGAQELKGLAGKTPAFAIGAERVVASRFEARSSGSVSAMFGREHELGLLLERWKLSKSGEGQLVLLTGEAGIGKSRLTQAMIDSVMGEPHTRLSYQCSPYHSDSALYPAIQQLTQAAGIAEGDSNDHKLDKLEAVLTGGDAQLIAALLGLDIEMRYGPLNLEPQQQRLQTLRALTGEVISLARGGAVLFIIEDVHWIDATTLELVNLCLEQISDSKVMMLLTARPTFSQDFGGHPIVTRLALNRLGRDQIAAIVAKLTKGKALPTELMDEIALKTDGVPLFVEELAKSVLESGELEERENSYILIGSLSHLAIPTTLHDSLMARLDRLQPVKEVAQMAACIGREFDYQLLLEISTLDDRALSEALERLISAELIFRRGLPPEASYIFKHALVRDAAYESLLKTRRKAIHAKLTDILEMRPQTIPELLAHHATEAGYLGKAITCWQLAGEQATERSANVEAIAHLSQAIELLLTQPESVARHTRELQLQTMLAGSMIAIKGYGAVETVQVFDRALVLSDHVRDPALLFPVYYGQWVVRFIKGGGRNAALNHAERFLDLAEGQERTGPKLVGHRIVAATLYYRGDLAAAAEHFKECIELYRPEEHAELTFRFGQHSKAGALCFLSNSLQLLGYPDQARALNEEAMETARQANHIHSLAYSLFFGLIRLCFCRRDLAGFEQGTLELSAIADEYKLPLWQAYAVTQRGYLLSRKNSPDQAVAVLQRGLEDLQATGAELDTPLALGQLAESYLVGERHSEALGKIDQAMAAVRDTEEHWFEPELFRLKGEILVRTNALEGSTEAEAAFRQSLKIARKQQAKAWELRTSASLAKLWAEQGERAKGQDLLQPVLDWFTEGFDTPDFKDASALLEELN